MLVCMYLRSSAFGRLWIGRKSSLSFQLPANPHFFRLSSPLPTPYSRAPPPSFLHPFSPPPPLFLSVMYRTYFCKVSFHFCRCLTSGNHKRNSIGFGYWLQPKYYGSYVWELLFFRSGQRFDCIFFNVVLICYFVVTFESLLWKTRSDARSN